MLAHRIRVFPGICGATDTIIDVYLDCIHDIACHPLYAKRDGGAQPGGGERPRHRSVPVHRLRQELASHLQLEPDSAVLDFNDSPAAARGTVASRRGPSLDVSRSLDPLNNVSKIFIFQV